MIYDVEHLMWDLEKGVSICYILTSLLQFNTVNPVMTMMRRRITMMMMMMFIICNISTLEWYYLGITNLKNQPIFFNAK